MSKGVTSFVSVQSQWPLELDPAVQTAHRRQSTVAWHPTRASLIIICRPDDIRDRQLSEHVMAMHDSTNRLARGADNSASGSQAGMNRGEAGSGPSSQHMHEFSAPQTTQSAHARAMQFAFATSQQNAAAAGRVSGGHDRGGAGAAGATADRERTPLEVRLKRGVGAIQPAELVPQALLRKYVAYARRFCFPALSAEAAAVLQDFYLSLRRKHGSPDSTPITTRQLEALIRLAEARAKIELRSLVTRDDAQDVVELMKESLYDAVTDDFGYGCCALRHASTMGEQSGDDAHAISCTHSQCADQSSAPCLVFPFWIAASWTSGALVG